MKLLFIDETSDNNNPNYLGVCAALIDSTKYGQIKREFHKHMKEYDWKHEVEFKGSWIFSSSKGCQNVPIEARIQLTKDIIAMNISSTNARIRFCYIETTVGSTKEQYLELLRLAVDSILKKSETTKHGKDVIAVYCDRRSDVNTSDIRKKLDTILGKRKLTLLEDVHLVCSNLDTVGICYADIVGYLMSRIGNIQVDSSLFEDLNSEVAQKNTQLKKYLTSSEIISSIKSMAVYKAIRHENSK